MHEVMNLALDAQRRAPRARGAITQERYARSFRVVSTVERVESCDGDARNRLTGVISTCHCPSTPSLKDAYAQFAMSIEHQFDEGTIEQVAALSSLVMFFAHHE